MLPLLLLVLNAGMADNAGILPGSVLLTINAYSVVGKPYFETLETLKASPRPMLLRLRRPPDDWAAPLPFVPPKPSEPSAAMVQQQLAEEERKKKEVWRSWCASNC